MRNWETKLAPIATSAFSGEAFTMAAPPEAASPEPQPESAASGKPERASAFRALRHRNYRLYFFGQLTSLAGTWMQSAAQAWLVLKLTNSSMMLGVVSFAQFLPYCW